MIPASTREELVNKRSRGDKTQKTCKSAYGGGRQYWANAMKSLGVVETGDKRLRFGARLKQAPGQQQYPVHQFGAMNGTISTNNRQM